VQQSQEEIILVTPVWNDSERLSQFGPQLARALAQSERSVRWVVSDDGSCSAEKEKLGSLIETFAQDFPNVEGHFLESRSRKGGAIYSAWARFPNAQWLAFVDADGAIDAKSLVRLLDEAIAVGSDHVTIAIRRNSPSTPVYRKAGRGLSFIVFRAFVKLLLGLNCADSQCGAKVIPAGAYFKIADQLQERGFVFDVELLLALKAGGLGIHELAVPWTEMPGGKVKPLRDAWSMLRGLLRIRARQR
jgi:dolichyl-phosphate beta-glucosyltransferase